MIVIYMFRDVKTYKHALNLIKNLLFNQDINVIVTTKMRDSLKYQFHNHI